MSVSEFEVHWRVGARHFSLTVDAEGVPHLDPPLSDDAAPGLPAPAARPGPARRGRAWTEDEEARLRVGFTAGEEPKALASELGRTPGAVRARLVVLGLLDEAEAGLRYPVQRSQ
jgi:hypothetical protein